MIKHLTLIGALSLSVVQYAVWMILAVQLYAIDDQAAASLRSSHLGMRPPECSHLYNNDQHRAWSECMGVSYK